MEIIGVSGLEKGPSDASLKMRPEGSYRVKYTSEGKERKKERKKER
jgi:hypothetical protein